MIAVVNAAKTFDGRPVWSGLSFEVGCGELLAVVGRSGSGKSTLLNCLGLLDRPDIGEILVDGTDITRFNLRRARLFRRDALGYLFQNYALIDNSTVTENLDVAVAARTRRSVRRAGHNKALERVGLANRSNEVVYRLSGGEQQRVAVARLLIKKPSIVLADEPTGALDADNGKVVIDLLREMGSQGCTIVVATHNEAVASSCDRILDLDHLAKLMEADG